MQARESVSSNIEAVLRTQSIAVMTRCQEACASGVKGNILEAFLLCDPFLDEKTVTNYVETLFQLTKRIDTLNYNIETDKPACTPEDIEKVFYIQKNIIRYVCHDILDHHLQLKSSIRALLCLENYNVTNNSLVYACVMNIAGSVIVSLMKQHKDIFSNEQWHAVSDAFIDRKTLTASVTSVLDQLFLDWIAEHDERLSFTELVSIAKQQSSDFIHPAKQMLESNDAGRIARAFDHYPEFIDSDFLKRISDDYCLYVQRLNPSSIREDERHGFFLAEDSEDACYLVEFQRRLIQLGIVDLLDHSLAIKTQVKEVMNVSADLNVAYLLGAYLSAANQFISYRAHPDKGNSRLTELQLSREIAVFALLNQNEKRLGWIAHALSCAQSWIFAEASIKKKRHPVSIEMPTLSSVSHYYPGIGLATAASAVFTVAAIATAGALGLFSSQQADQSSSDNRGMQPGNDQPLDAKKFG